MSTFQKFIDTLVTRFSPINEKFNKDDAVQHVSGGPLMIVLWVKRYKKDAPAIVFCKWYDSERKSTKTNIFPETDLKVFDWYNPS